jgi:hypothetical protein
VSKGIQRCKSYLEIKCPIKKRPTFSTKPKGRFVFPAAFHRLDPSIPSCQNNQVLELLRGNNTTICLYKKIFPRPKRFKTIFEMAPPSPLTIATSSVSRLVKEEASYHKELLSQEARLKKLEEGTEEDENREFSLKQEVCLLVYHS